MTVLDIIGQTRLIPLRHIVPEKSARILVKLEYENPTGSMKDRMALAMVEAAEADGRLRPGGSVVEYTGGSTGVSLAFVCAAKRIPLQIVTSEAFSKEKRDHMTALGAQLTLVGSPTGGTTKALTLEMIEDRAKTRIRSRELLDGSVEQHRSASQLRSDGRGDMGADGREGRRLCPKRRHCRFTAGDLYSPSSPQQSGAHRGGRAPRSRLYCRAGRVGLTGSKAPAPGSLCRCGPRLSLTRSRRYRLRKRWRPPGVWLGKKAYLQARPRAETSRWRYGWPNVWDPPKQWSQWRLIQG